MKLYFEMTKYNHGQNIREKLCTIYIYIYIYICMYMYVYIIYIYIYNKLLLIIKLRFTYGEMKIR